MTSVKVVGVGGQGILTTSQVIGLAAMRAGHQVMTSEIHGLAQRGGAVDSNIKFGKTARSSGIDKGGADFLLSLELLEAARNASFLRPRGCAVVSTTTIRPKSINGAQAYPGQAEVRRILGLRTDVIYLTDAAKEAEGIGEPRVENLVLVGSISALLSESIPERFFDEVVRDFFPPRFVGPNLKALAAGREIVQRST
ncbi:MAG: 2-oxoacid:acceptor oxidoreductase family protein [Aigarchaeota archaeon]|nr:2-oxoacid:acceptor oxidoreductase family protein [Aigarchaeota archaeon]